VTRPGTSARGNYRGTCHRCERHGLVLREFTGQDLCASCYRAAFTTTGTCQECNEHRVLPARNGQHPICAMCAGLDKFRCEHCGDNTSPMQHRSQCQRCRLHELLADRDEPATTIDRFVELLVGKPDTTLTRWTTPGQRLTAYLKRITDSPVASLTELVGCGSSHRAYGERGPAGLPIFEDSESVDGKHHQLVLFERWTERFLPTVTDPADRRVVMMFVSWHEHRKLTRSIDIGTLKTWSTRTARQRISHGAIFLSWLRDRDTALAACTQTDLDTWFTTGTTSRYVATGFIVWAQTQQLCDRRLRITPVKPGTPPGMPEPERVELIRRLLADTTIRLDDRVAGLLVALYAQPASRICQIRRNAITITDAATLLTLGPKPIEVVAPFGQLLAQLVKTSNNRWLFPGTIAGEPCSPNTTGLRLRRVGITRATRVAALHDLISQIPGPVLAELIGYNPNFVAERAVALAALWTSYPRLRNPM
jgi:hypothetical protein